LESGICNECSLCKRLSVYFSTYLKYIYAKKAFTLVELIVVITILAILWTIAFISLQWYSANARDSRRIADIWNIKKSLELFTLQTEKYPLPDNGETVTYSWEIVWTQWTLWDNVVEQLSRNIKKKPLDPITEEEYIYSTTENQREYEVLAIYEWWIANNTVTNQTHAADTWYVKVDGTYNQLYTETDSYTIPVPSLITSEELPLILDATNIQSQVVTWQLNRPARVNTTIQTGSLDIVLSAYAWKITKTSTDQEKIDIITAVQNAYTGTTLATQETYTNLLSQTSTWSQVSFANTVSLGEPEPIPLAAAPDPTWKDFDPNCSIDDIVIWDQTWAGCNSTLWIGVERWKRDDGSDGTLSNCMQYNNSNGTQNCGIWTTNMASNSSARLYFDVVQPSGTNSYWDTEFDNIWWKFYTWDNSATACSVGRHVPSFSEWEILETTLNGSNCRNGASGQNCSGLWWRSNNTKTASNNVAQALQMPFSGLRNSNGYGFNGRGRYTFMWLSTPFSSNAYYMSLYWSELRVNIDNISRSFAFSVRCIKD